MSDNAAGDNVVYWPRVKEILDGLMDRWKERWASRPRVAPALASGM